MQRRFGVSVEARHGCEIYAVAPKSGPSAGGVIYLHGGAYIAEITRVHWRFIVRMVDRLRMTFIVPLYPLAPENDCAMVMAFVLAAYRDVLTRHDPSPVVFMGDS